MLSNIQYDYGGFFFSTQFRLDELFIKILSTNPIRGNNRGVKVTWWFFPNWPFLPLPFWFLKHICKFPILKGNFLPGVGLQFYKMVSKCVLRLTWWSVRSAFVRNVAGTDPVKWNIKLDPKVKSEMTGLPHPQTPELCSLWYAQSSHAIIIAPQNFTKKEIYKDVHFHFAIYMFLMV